MSAITSARSTGSRTSGGGCTASPMRSSAWGATGRRRARATTGTAATASARPIPRVESLIRAEAAAQGVAQRKPGAEEIVERCLLRLVNEGAQVLDEGIAMRASDIDTIYLTGYGFPAWRGGPMWQAENIVGLKMADGENSWVRKVHGPRWASCAAAGPAGCFRRQAGGRRGGAKAHITGDATLCRAWHAYPLLP